MLSVCAGRVEMDSRKKLRIKMKKMGAEIKRLQKKVDTIETQMEMANIILMKAAESLQYVKEEASVIEVTRAGMEREVDEVYNMYEAQESEQCNWEVECVEEEHIKINGHVDEAQERVMGDEDGKESINSSGSGEAVQEKVKSDVEGQERVNSDESGDGVQDNPKVGVLWSEKDIQMNYSGLEVYGSS